MIRAYINATTKEVTRAVLPGNAPTPFWEIDGNTVGWYDSSDIATITKNESDAVSVWSDKSGNEHHLLQEDETKQPIWSADGITFDGINDFMKTLPFEYNNPAMLYFVVKPIGLIRPDGIFMFEGDAHYNMTVVFYTETIQIFNGGAWVSTPITLGNWIIVRAFFNKQITPGIEKNRITGGNSEPQYGSAGANTPGGFAVGGGDWYAWASSNFQVAEVILRKGEDTPTNETMLYNYLTSKYSRLMGILTTMLYFGTELLYNTIL